MRRFAYPWLKPDFEVVFGVANVFTRWDIRDSNSRVIDATNPEHGNYKDQISVHREGDPRRRDIVLPVAFPARRTQAMRLRMGDAMFSAQMQQNPYPPVRRYLTEESSALDGEHAPKFSGTTRRSIERRAAGRFATRARGLRRGDDDRRVAAREHLHYAHRPEAVSPSGADQGAHQPCDVVPSSTDRDRVHGVPSDVLHWLKETTRNIDIHLPVVQRPRGGPESKLRRIMSIDPHWSSKRIVVNPSEPNVKEFVAEASRWTGKKSDQDDMLDALADCIAFMKKPPLVGEDRTRAVKEGLIAEPVKEDQRQTGRAILGMLEKTSGSAAKCCRTGSDSVC